MIYRRVKSDARILASRLTRWWVLLPRTWDSRSRTRQWVKLQGVQGQGQARLDIQGQGRGLELQRQGLGPALIKTWYGTKQEVIYASLKSNLVGYNSLADRLTVRVSFVRLAVVASQNLRNYKKNRTCSSSRSSKVIDLDGNRKRIICNFLLVTNNNIWLISYQFRDNWGI